jgi:hypothetical protein
MGSPHKRTPPGARAALRFISDQADERTSDKPPRGAVESDPSKEAAVLARIREAACNGDPAPSTDELVELLGFCSHSTVTAVLRRLQLRGLIYFESFQRGRRFWLPDGRSTALPPCTSLPWRWRAPRHPSARTNLQFGGRTGDNDGDWPGDAA